MLVDDQDALKTWLTNYLEPICDADPAALSKYVMALLKKERPLGDLRASMGQQMEVFLQSETAQFIASLFDAIDSKDYLNSGSAPKRIKKEVLSGDEEAKVEPVTASEVKDEPASDEQGKSSPSAAIAADSTTPTRAKQQQEEEEDAHAAARVRGRSGRHYHSRKYASRRRSQSPLPPPDRPLGRRLGRRLGSPPGRPRYLSRSRSPPPPYGHRRSRRRSRSYSPMPLLRRRADASRGSTPTKDEAGVAATGGEGPPYLPSTVTVPKRPRCRDYDEKGFCMRGDQCKFDHGADAVVLEDSSTSSYSTPYTPAIPPGVPQAAPGAGDPYVPSGLPLPPLHVPPPGYQISAGYAVPVAAVPNPRKRPFNATVFNRIGAHPGSGFHRGQGGGDPSGDQRLRPPQLAVRNIPPHLNNIAHLNNHFARFGTLVNIQAWLPDG